ncbi:MAG: hypothetical protein ACREP4_06610 [Stenotrophomonas sp.]|uniref:hypothetical protein n=1 Tax=Stenotrophomonas sp. TaxID=69392 RepID=UPI003D6D0C8B
MKKILLALVAVILLAGAKSTIGDDFNTNNLTQLQINQTTLPQAVVLLGTQPVGSAVGQSGAVAYTWQYVEAKGSMWTGKSSSTSRRAVLVFNTDGTFQRILQLDGVTLPPSEQQRLMTTPAIEATVLLQRNGEQ